MMSTLYTNRTGMWQSLSQPYDTDPLPPGGGYRVPSQWDYYKAGFRKHFFPGHQESSDRFIQEMIDNPKKRWGLFSSILGLGVLMAAASTPLRRVIHGGILAILLPIPIVNANRTIPKLNEAYRTAKQGNPKKADRMFDSALREFNYSLFQNFLKPVTLALAATTLLALPQSFAKPKTEWLAMGGYYLKKTANRLFGTSRYDLGGVNADLETRTIVETLICSPLEWLNRFKAPKLQPASGSGNPEAIATWSEWLGQSLERLGWKRRFQPYPLLRQFNVVLRKHGDDWETWLRKSSFLNRLLGTRSTGAVIGAPPPPPHGTGAAGGANARG